MNHRRAAILTILAAALMDVACGLAYAFTEHQPIGQSLFCGVANAVTEGSCPPPATVAGHLIDLVEFVLVVPLVAAVFSLLTSGLAGMHTAASEERLKAHLEERLHHHLHSDETRTE